MESVPGMQPERNGGIAPVDGVFIRPLLCLKREEIESYLVNRGISYCTDETNLEDGHTRNRIRNHVIPYLEEQVNERAVSHMSETMEQMRQLWKYVESETTRYAARCIKCIVLLSLKGSLPYRQEKIQNT